LREDEKGIEEIVLTEVLAGAGISQNRPASLIQDPDAASEAVDRMLELLAARIDPHVPRNHASAGGQPPEYRDTRRGSAL